MTDDKVLKLAKCLRDMYDLSFGSRAWEDLPPGEADRWIEDARDLIERMKS